MHHLFISAIVVSFEKIPLLQCYLSASLFEYIIKISSNLFYLAIKLGAPIIAILLFTTAAFGMINKSVPQLHIMIIGMPLKITAGLVAIGLIMPTFIMMLKRTFPLLEGYVYNTISLAKLP
jgi:flagellar biosynthetic protein FliR